MGFDCVWYKPEGRDKALKLVNRLPVAECSRRRLPYGLRFWLDSVQMPLNNFGPCTFVTRNFFGSSAINPCSEKIFEFCKIEEADQYYIAANFVIPPQSIPSIAAAGEVERRSEDVTEKEFQAQGGMSAVYLRKGSSRFFRAQGILQNKIVVNENELEVRADCAALSRFLEEEKEQRKILNVLKNILTRKKLKPVQMRFLESIYPFFITGEIPSYQPKPLTDSPEVVEQYHRHALLSIMQQLNSGQRGG